MNQPRSENRRIAVIGAGISGLSAAWLLRQQADVVLFEQDTRPGGHADTQHVTLAGTPHAVDTGFIVYNERNYPNLTGLFAHLGIATRPSKMSFGVSINDGAFEYSGDDSRMLAAMFAQKRNALRPAFWSMLRDIARFHREAPALLATDSTESLGDYLGRNRYGTPFIERHILPMGAAIWSASVVGMRDFPARQFVRFFHNHGLLTLKDPIQWRTVTGGSRVYVTRMMADLPAPRLGCRVASVARDDLGVLVRLADGSAERFDHAILASHADQSLAMLEQPTPDERALLGAVRCEDNLAVLHTDISFMPRRRAAWSAWNYLSANAQDHAAPVSLTYWMNCLQGIDSAAPLLVTLNPARMPDPALVLRTRHYRHPQFDAAAMRAQEALPGIQGKAGIWFAGAWTGWGFHEDGIASSVRIAAALGVAAPWAAADRSAALPIAA